LGFCLVLYFVVFDWDCLFFLCGFYCFLVVWGFCFCFYCCFWLVCYSPPPPPPPPPPPQPQTTPHHHPRPPPPHPPIHTTNQPPPPPTPNHRRHPQPNRSTHPPPPPAPQQPPIPNAPTPRPTPAATPLWPGGPVTTLRPPAVRADWLHLTAGSANGQALSSSARPLRAPRTTTINPKGPTWPSCPGG